MKKLNIGVVFIGKPQWEAGWPYLGYNNEMCISIRLNLLWPMQIRLMY